MQVLQQGWRASLEIRELDRVCLGLWVGVGMGVDGDANAGAMQVRQQGSGASWDCLWGSHMMGVACVSQIALLLVVQPDDTGCSQGCARQSCHVMDTGAASSLTTG
jgi:hypothetical protein